MDSSTTVALEDVSPTVFVDEERDYGFTHGVLDDEKAVDRMSSALTEMRTPLKRP